MYGLQHRNITIFLGDILAPFCTCWISVSKLTLWRAFFQDKRNPGQPKPRLFTVGRLDVSTSGLIIVTNDGIDIAVFYTIHGYINMFIVHSNCLNWELFLLMVNGIIIWINCIHLNLVTIHFRGVCAETFTSFFQFLKGVRFRFVHHWELMIVHIVTLLNFHLGTALMVSAMLGDIILAIAPFRLSLKV